MQRPGRVPDQAIGPLLTSAALLDYIILFLLAALLQDAIGQTLTRQFPLIAEGYQTFVLFLFLLPFFWVLIELVLSGWSLGRFAHGLIIRGRDGKPLRPTQRASRALRKLSCAGLSGANPMTPSRYDTRCDVFWYSTLVPPEPRPLQRWQIQFMSGALSGKKQSLGKFKSFRSRGEIKFGRDRFWADVPMSDQDVSVSARHCSLLVHNGKLYLRDGDGSGQGSSNGTFIGTKRLRAAKSAPLGSAATFSIGDVRVKMLR